MQNMVIKEEWLLVVRGPRARQKGHISVEIEGVDTKDQPMVKAVAEVVRVWLSATRRQP